MNRAVRALITMAVFSTAIHGSGHEVFADDASSDPVKITVIEGQVPSKPDDSPSPQPVLSCNFPSSIDAEQGEAIVRQIAKEERFDLDLVLAIARQENGFRMNSVSSAGAVGLMQLMPGTAKRFEVNICDPKDNVRGGIRYLRLLQKRYQNPLYVLAAYNAGEGSVEQNRGIPLYPETVRYVSAILTDLYGWKPLETRTAKGQAHNIKNKQEKPDADSRESWTQGFVLHVE